jgi:GAF domain-containing protein
MTSGHHDDLVVALRAAAGQLARRRSIRDLEQTLEQIVASAVATVPGVDAGSISMTEHDRIATRCPTTDTIGKLDEKQSELHEGPCITAIDDPPASGVVVAEDLAGADGERWPRFAPYAVEAGYRALLSTQLSMNGGVRAALNLYSATPDAFDEDARTLAGLFGIQAAVLLYGVDTATHLQRAVDSRDLIGQAKGVLRERFGVDDEGAFQMLVKSSQDTNMKLTAVARWLLDNADDSAHGGDRGPAPSDGRGHRGSSCG